MMAANPTLDAALEYAERLSWRVFPLAGKVPLEDSHGVNDASSNPDQVRALWGRFPGKNIGVAGGPGSGVWFLDVDPRHGGGATLETLTAQHGELPDTPRQDTGGGGEHYVFAWPDDGRVVRSRGGIAQGIDTRGAGGYVVVAPSIHPETGQPYVWDEDDHPLKISPAQAPGWLLDMVTENPQQKTAKTEDEWAGVMRGRVAGEGRHEALLTIGGLLFRRLPATVAYALAVAWNEARLSPPLERHDLDRVLTWIAKAELHRMKASNE